MYSTEAEARTTKVYCIESIFHRGISVFTLVHLRHFEEAGSGGLPCEPNRVTAAPLVINVLGFMNTRYVMRNYRIEINKILGERNGIYN